MQSPRKKRGIAQKIIIPSGVVRPNETVVIEVPPSLKRHAVVVAKRSLVTEVTTSQPTQYEVNNMEGDHPYATQEVPYNTYCYDEQEQNVGINTETQNDSANNDYTEYTNTQEEDTSHYVGDETGEGNAYYQEVSYSKDQKYVQSQQAPQQLQSGTMHAKAAKNEYVELTPESPPFVPVRASDVLHPEAIEIDEAEKKEREMLFKNLMAFHRARRDVIQSTKNIISRQLVDSELVYAMTRASTPNTYTSTHGNALRNRNSYGYEQKTTARPTPSNITFLSQ